MASLKGKQRDSNIELLRILTICGVIILHYNNRKIGGGLKCATSTNFFILQIIETVFVCAVNTFVLIMGYFMSTTERRSLIKPLELIIQVVIFRAGFYLLGTLIGSDVFSLRGFMESLLPINYFVILYCALYFISPMINMFLKSISPKLCFRYLVVLFTIISVWPIAVDVIQGYMGKSLIGLSTIGVGGSQDGYTITNFALLYFIGAYIRLRDVRFGKKMSALGFVGVVILVVIWAGFDEVTAWSYCNPLVIFLAVFSFMLFKQINIGYSKVINELAKGAFIVFLIHTRFLKHIGISTFVQRSAPIMLLHMAMSACAIYLVCWIVYEIYQFTIGRVLGAVMKRIPLLNIDLYGQEGEGMG